MKEFAVLGKDELDGVSRMFRFFAPVDIPEGLAKADPDYDVYEQTLCTSVMCAESGVYYFAPAQNRRISAVRLPAQGNEMRYFDLGDNQDIEYGCNQGDGRGGEVDGGQGLHSDQVGDKQPVHHGVKGVEHRHHDGGEGEAQDVSACDRQVIRVQFLHDVLIPPVDVLVIPQVKIPKEQEARQDFTLLILTNAVVGAVMMALGYALMDTLLGAMGLSPAVFGYCRTYLSNYLLFTIPILLMYNFSLYLIAADKSTLSLICTVAGGVTNIILDYALISLFDLGIQGAWFCSPW